MKMKMTNVLSNRKDLPILAILYGNEREEGEGGEGNVILRRR